jgi:type IV pilus assembly protein PilP
VGIIQAPSGSRALVQESSGKGYVVKKGTYIGTNSGKVVKILKDRIIIEEESEDIYGKPSIIKKPLKLQKPPGE